ncbi:hypothetical protein BCD67_01060 [Oscillatoriales cyanobacterium USR001]|nr:hypothetical protein BCD67_01060 [Oscillatoriales cyanobacterium USR001]
MILASLLSLTIFLISAAIALGSDRKTLDGIPTPIAAVVGVLSLIWFVAISPCLLKIGLVMAVAAFVKLY